MRSLAFCTPCDDAALSAVEEEVSGRRRRRNVDAREGFRADARVGLPPGARSVDVLADLRCAGGARDGRDVMTGSTTRGNRARLNLNVSFGPSS